MSSQVEWNPVQSNRVKSSQIESNRAESSQVKMGVFLACRHALCRQRDTRREPARSASSPRESSSLNLHSISGVFKLENLQVEGISQVEIMSCQSSGSPCHANQVEVMPIKWKSCQSSGSHANQVEVMPTKWKSCQPSGGHANQVEGMPIKWRACQSSGSHADQVEGMPIKWWA